MTFLHTAADLVIKNGTKTKRVTALPSRARSNADDTLAAFPAGGLIFRGPLRQIQAQSHFAAETRNIPELGISTGIPLTEYRVDVPNTRDRTVILVTIHNFLVMK